MQYTNLKLTSYEPEGAYEARIVKLRDSVSCGKRDDYFWADISPAFIPPMLGISVELATVLLAPRFAGDSLNDIGAEGIHVYVCTTRSTPIDSKLVAVDDVKILNWGLLEIAKKPY